MAILIGLVASEKSILNLKKMIEKNDFEVDFDYLAYKDIEDVEYLLKEKEAVLDGFLFSGELIYRYFKSLNIKLEKPSWTLNITALTLHQFFLKLLLKNRNLDSSRLFLDFIYDDNLMGLNNVFDEEDIPKHMDSLDDDLGYNIKKSFEMQKELFEKHEIDISVTRMGELYQDLLDEGFNAVLIGPSEKDFKNKIAAIVQETKYTRLKGQKIVIANISLKQSEVLDIIKYNETELMFNSLYEAIINYGRDFDYKFIIQRHSLGYEIILYAYDLKRITNNYRTCSLMTYLKRKVEFEVKIGWAEGRYINKVRTMAENAVYKSARKDGIRSFLIREDNRVFGPLKDDFLSKKDEYIDLADISNKSQLKVESIVIIAEDIEKTGSKIYTSTGIASLLNLSTRSANRALKKLNEAGYAEILKDYEMKTKGRPRNFFEINF